MGEGGRAHPPPPPETAHEPRYTYRPAPPGAAPAAARGERARGPGAAFPAPLRTPARRRADTAENEGSPPTPQPPRAQLRRSSPSVPLTPAKREGGGGERRGGAVGRDLTPLNHRPPEPSRSARALTGQEQRARQSERPHGLHGDVGSARRKERPQTPRPRAPDTSTGLSPLLPTAEPAGTAAALPLRLINAGHWKTGGSRSAAGQLERTTPNMQPMERLEGRARRYRRQSWVSMCGFLRTERGRRRLAGRRGRLANRFRGGV